VDYIELSGAPTLTAGVTVVERQTMSVMTFLRIHRASLAACAVVALAGATGCASSGPVTSANPNPIARSQQRGHHNATSLIQHVVVIVQENRSVDNLFNGFPGADTVQSGYDSKGNLHTLQPVSMSAECDPSHKHGAFVAEFRNGAMNGWNKESISCATGATLPDGVFAFVPQSETVAYWSMASNYGLADEVLQTNEGPSFPAHQYLIAGQSGGHGSDAPWAFSENGPGASSSKLEYPGSDSSNTADSEKGFGSTYCGAPAKTTVVQIDLSTKYPGVEGNPAYPCKDYQTIFDLATNAGLSWAYYSHSSSSLWSGPDAVAHLWANPSTRAIVPETNVLSDISAHRLANVVFVTPSGANSDHPHHVYVDPKSGPNWVSSIVDAIGNDPYYWSNTTILITWDDWGGWFDHVVPTHPFTNDPYEYGFRVPLVVVSPYVKAGIVDHTARNFDSVLTYIESTFGLPSLGMQDSQTDDLGSMFDYSQSPLPFIPPTQ
jgi:phospholipase C